MAVGNNLKCLNGKKGRAPLTEKVFKRSIEKLCFFSNLHNSLLRYIQHFRDLLIKALNHSVLH